MEDFKYWWDYFTNNKLVLIILIAILVIVVVLIILAHTSFGKKNIETQNEKIDATINLVKDKTKNIDEYKEQINEDVQKIETGFDKVNELSDIRFTKLLLEYKNFKADVFEVLKVIPNAKVKTLTEKLMAKYDNEEDLIEPFNTDLYELLNDEGDIKARLDKIEQFINESKKEPQTSDLTEEKGEHDDGEQEENTDQTEEVA